MADKLRITPKPFKGEDGHKTFSIRLENKLMDRLEHFVIETGRSRNELIGIFLEYGMDNCIIDKK